jgi:AcrR family transcriptional regulator
VGRDEVAAAVLEAAAELFAERGPTATSIRDVAARSKVNHGLVFRHFGTKDRLVGAVLDHLAGTITDLRHAGAAPAEIEQAAGRHSRVMARALLDGYPAGQLQTSFPNLADLLEQIRPSFDDDTSARLAAANVVALQLGWQLFQPFLCTALGLDAVDDAVLRGSVAAAAADLAEPR